MKYFFKFANFFILIFFVILQVVLGEQLKLYNINFDFILVTLVAITFKEGLLTGVIYGFTAGLIFDALSGGIIGISSLIFTLNAFIIHELVESGLKLKLVSYVFVVFIITEIDIIVVDIIYYLFNFSINFVSLGINLITKPFFNLILIFIIFPLLRLKFTKEETFE